MESEDYVNINDLTPYVESNNNYLNRKRKKKEIKGELLSIEERRQNKPFTELYKNKSDNNNKIKIRLTKAIIQLVNNPQVFFSNLNHTDFNEYERSLKHFDICREKILEWLNEFIPIMIKNDNIHMINFFLSNGLKNSLKDCTSETYSKTNTDNLTCNEFVNKYPSFQGILLSQNKNKKYLISVISQSDTDHRLLYSTCNNCYFNDKSNLIFVHQIQPTDGTKELIDGPCEPIALSSLMRDLGAKPLSKDEVKETAAFTNTYGQRTGVRTVLNSRGIEYEEKEFKANNFKELLKKNPELAKYHMITESYVDWDHSFGRHALYYNPNTGYLVDEVLCNQDDSTYGYHQDQPSHIEEIRQYRVNGRQIITDIPKIRELRKIEREQGVEGTMYVFIIKTPPALNNIYYLDNNCGSHSGYCTG